MRRMVHILLLLLLPFVATFAGVVLTKETNLPRPGDKLTDIFTSEADAYRVNYFGTD